jgi:AcrR family transcriptional regulator
MEENTRKPDRRIMKSKRAIKKAFLTILSAKDINDITIKNIADVADVDRKTVYNYYNGTYEILNEIENEMVNTINETVRSINIEGSIGSHELIFKKISEVVTSNMEFYNILMKLSYDSQLIKKLITVFSEYSKKIIAQYKLPEGLSIDNASIFVTSGVLNVYHSWFNSDRTVSFEEISSQLATLVANSLGIAK